MTTIECYGDRTGYLGSYETTRKDDVLARARSLARSHALRLDEPVEARVITARGSYWFGVRHVPGVTEV